MNTHRRLLPDAFIRLWNTPADELNRWQRWTRNLAEMCLHSYRRLRADRAGQMAAALAFRTALGVIPVIVIILLIFRAIGGSAEFATLVENLLRAGGLEGVLDPEQEQSLAQWLTERIQSLDASAAKGAVGLVGGLILAWAAIGLMTTIERSFNQIFRASESRSLLRRITLYWTALTVGPLILALIFFLTRRLDAAIADLVWLGWAVRTLSNLTGYALTFFLLFGLYRLMPNTAVRSTPAAIGAALAAVLWTVAVRLFAAYLAIAFTNSASPITMIYGTLGLVPVFLLWIYLVWIIVLFGLEVTATIQTFGMGGTAELRRLGRERSLIVDPLIVLPLATLIARRFAEGETANLSDLAAECRIDREPASAILRSCVSAGLLRIIGGEEDDEPGFLPARPPESIAVADLLRAAYDASWPRRTRLDGAKGALQPALDVRDRLLESQDTGTLADLLRSAESPPQTR